MFPLTIVFPRHPDGSGSVAIHTNAGDDILTIELPTDLATLLIEMRATLNEINAKLDSQHGAFPPPSAPEPRAWYSVGEVSALLNKSRYTVREWCRNSQINAAKRAERRGAAALWSISAEEVTRYRNEGLPPIDPDRNNVN
jgi:hypothetical protein